MTRVICVEEGSELDDIANEVFTADDVTRRCCCNITNYHPEKEQFGIQGWEKRVGQILIHFLIHHTFLVTSEKVVQTFLSTVSQSVKDGREYQGKFYSIQSVNFESLWSDEANDELGIKVHLWMGMGRSLRRWKSSNSYWRISQIIWPHVYF